jgi:hypothetical protein
MSQFLSSNELFINVKNPPKWNPKKHFYDQSVDVLDFYLEEKTKITEGITIGGYFIHPWLYWHINFFKTPIPLNKKDILMCPPLDDNFLYIIESYQEAEEKNLGLGLFGCRGFAKSTMIASLITWLNSTRSPGTTSVVGGSEGDLAAISNLLSIGFSNVTPAMFIPQLITDWKKQVKIGVKEKDGFHLDHSTVKITNGAAGTDNASEKGAGLSPIGFIADEIGKYNCKQLIQSALPSFTTQDGAKLVHMLCGTTGNQSLSKDAKDIITNPAAYKLLPMNWDRLDRSVPEFARTWERSRKESFATFVPGQMSYRLESKKKEISLGEYVGKTNPELSHIKIQVTDWPNATKLIQDTNTSFKKEEDKEKNRMYFPIEIADVFITSASNPFPTAIIDKHIRYLEDEGLLGKNVEIYRSVDGFKQEFSDKKRAEVSHGGGEADAPVILFGDMPIEKPPTFKFVSGLDDYKLDQSDTDSLGAFYVLKRRNLEPNSPSEVIVASHVSRPARHAELHQTWETMLECWNAICNMEAVDTMFLQFLNFKKKAEQCLAPAMSFSNSTNNGTQKSATKFGVYPTGGNKRYMFNLLVDYCREEHVMGIDEQGNEIIKYGVEFIDDIDLLKEMLNWRVGGNFDRITAFMHALTYARELDKTEIRPKDETKPKFQANSYREKPRLSVYGNIRPSAF